MLAAWGGRSHFAVRVIFRAEVPDQRNADVVVEAAGMRTDAVFRSTRFHRAVRKNYVVIGDVVVMPPIERSEASAFVKFVPSVYILG